MSFVEKQFTVIAVALVCVIHGQLVTADPSIDHGEPTANIPIWAVILGIVVIAILSLTLIFVFIRKRIFRSPRSKITEDGISRTATPNEDVLREKDTESLEKRPSFGSLRTLVTSRVGVEKEFETANDAPPLPSSYVPALKKDLSQTEYLSHPFQEMSIALPLPPPSSSLFADKLELNSNEANDIFQKYMNTGHHDEEKSKGFVSVDLDMPYLYANMQHKAATLRNTLRQSLRRQKSNSKPAPIQEVFEPQVPEEESVHHPSGRRSSIASRQGPMSRQDLHTVLDAPLPKKKVTIAQQPQVSISDKIMVDNTASPCTFDKEEDDDWKEDEAPMASLPLSDTEDPAEHENHANTIHAARMIIRTASRKSRRRSTMVDDDTLQRTALQAAEDGSFYLSPQARREAAGYFSSVRSRDPRVMENLTMTTGSARRLVRDSIVGNGRASVSAVAMRNKQGPTAQDIAGWWQETQTSEKEETKPRDSLSANPAFAGKEMTKQNGANGISPIAAWEGVQPRCSQRAGTLGRSTQRMITDLKESKLSKHLFDSSKKEEAEDSLKMEVSPNDADELTNPSSNKYAVTEDIRLSTDNHERPSIDGPRTKGKKKKVDTIRRMIQGSWTGNLKPSGSMNSLASLSEQTPSKSSQFLSVAGYSSTKRPSIPAAFNTGNNEIHPCPYSSSASNGKGELSKRALIHEDNRSSSGDESGVTMLPIGKKRETMREAGVEYGSAAAKHLYNDEGPSSNHHSSSKKKGFFGSLRVTNRKAHTPGDSPTPAQEERDRYLRQLNDFYPASEHDEAMDPAASVVRPQY
ncbi:uncharacterized protein BYT42DRAFT_542269 [Radiomyces spectabilis]|uniref:uncharacterized protein n=1 Tax=Radiomyces spectabilis TaxID=64574 RepID=UPI002220FC09|nr:uncharacterized protein BYT42DRAFT_542269 [Radiomyces spectabilis]KAI8394116.1 hypothetical protein BYT42DRAFT_542269 [Radiomyces spectabilis]